MAAHAPAQLAAARRPRSPGVINRDFSLCRSNEDETSDGRMVNSSEDRTQIAEIYLVILIYHKKGLEPLKSARQSVVARHLELYCPTSLSHSEAST